MSDELLTIPQIAQLTDRSIYTVASWRQHGRGPRMFRRRNRVYAYKSDVLAWLARQDVDIDVRGGLR